MNELIQRPQRWIGIASVALLITSFICALLYGAVDISLRQLLLATFFGQETEQAVYIVQSIRFPRALLAAIIGALLAACGAAMQGLFRNPLAEPSLIGVTAGASLGGSLMIFCGQFVAVGMLTLSLVSIGAFLGGIIAVLVVSRIATRQTGTSVSTMLLAGIAITALAGSFTNLLEFYSDNETLRRISLWKMGGLEGANGQRVTLAFCVACVIFIILPRYAVALNVFLLGESEARHLGINIEKTKRVLITLTAAGVGCSVALAGTISFVGLIVPHMVRMLIGPCHKTLIPISAVCGASLLLLADTLSRTIMAPVELPVGVVTSIIGVPVFVSLLRKSINMEYKSGAGLHVRSLSAQIKSRSRTKQLFEDISFEVEPGEVLTIIGPNGAGKTSVFKTLTGEIPAEKGSVYFNEKAIRSIPIPIIAKSIGILPQLSLLNFPYSVTEVVNLGRTPHDTGTIIDSEIICEAMRIMDMDKLSSQLYTELSGGEKQRTQLARVMAQIWRSQDSAQRLLLLDEPTNTLDLGHQRQLMTAIRRFADQGVAIIMIIHDINIAASYSDKLLAMKDGQSIAYGSVESVVTEENMKKLFEIDIHVEYNSKNKKPMILSHVDAS